MSNQKLAPKTFADYEQLMNHYFKQDNGETYILRYCFDLINDFLQIYEVTTHAEVAKDYLSYYKNVAETLLIPNIELETTNITKKQLVQNLDEGEQVTFRFFISRYSDDLDPTEECPEDEVEIHLDNGMSTLDRMVDWLIWRHNYLQKFPRK